MDKAKFDHAVAIKETMSKIEKDMAIVERIINPDKFDTFKPLISSDTVTLSINDILYLNKNQCKKIYNMLIEDYQNELKKLEKEFEEL